MATIDVKAAQIAQRKANQQIRRTEMQSRQAGPDRLAAIAAANKAPVVRVIPRDPVTRKWLKHEPTKIAFRNEGSVEWPLDKFTLRRLRDGDITIETQDVELPQSHHSRGRTTKE
jgi:hypothetical protein